MNNDLISREALLEAIRTDVAPFTLSMVFRHIHSAPAVDAVEVVRCRECRHHIHDDDVDFLCTITGVYTRHDDFCSYGERRADNG